MSSPNTSPRSAWQLLAFLTLLNVVNFVDRQLITSLQVPIREELGLSPLQITVLAGYAFAVIYAIAGLFLGTVADRWHRPRLIALGLFVWSALTAASGLAQNFWQLSLARFFIGIGEVTLTPAAIAMLSDVFQPRQRALASGLYYLGIPIGAGLSLIVGGSFGNFLGGWLGDLFHKRWSGGRLLAVVAIQAVIAPFGMAFRLLPPDSFLFLLCGLLSPILVTMIYGPIYASVQELTPIRVRATMIAVLIVGLMLLGASLGGPLAAYIAERLMAAGFAQPLTAGIFIAGQVGLLAIPLLFLAARRYSHDLARVHETV